MYGNVIFDAIPAGDVIDLFDCGNAIERIYSFHFFISLFFHQYSTVSPYSQGCRLADNFSLIWFCQHIHENLFDVSLRCVFSKCDCDLYSFMLCANERRMILSYVRYCLYAIHDTFPSLSIYIFKPIRKGWQPGREHDVHCQPLIYRFESNLQPTLFFLFRLPFMPGLFSPLALYVFQSHKGSHIQTAGAIVLFWFFHFEVYNLRFDFCKIALPHDRFKLSTLVHLEGPLTLLLATVICISLKCHAWAVAGGESQPYSTY